MKILFVYTEVNVKFGSYGFQHGLAALSAYLKAHGYADVDLCYIGPRFSARPFRAAVSARRPDVIAFYATHDQFRFALRLLSELRDAHGVAVFGGPHATLFPGLIERHPRIGAVCCGEGEEALLALVRALDNGEPYDRIPGLWVRSGNRVVRNRPRPFIADLDALPFADRELFRRIPTRTRVGLTQISFRNSFRVSRGCPFRCSFCSNFEIGRAQPGTFLRFRSASNVLREMETVVARYGPREVYFEDDTFTLSEPFLDALCETYPRRIGLPFEFFARIGPDTVRILEKLRKAGGRRVSFGVECGNEDYRRNVLKKDFSNAQVENVFAAARRMGYKTEAFVIGGLPDETPALFRDTVELLRRIQPDLYSMSIYFPFRGTELFQLAVERGYVHPDFELPETFVSRRDTVLHMPEFTREQILACVRRFGWDVYKGISPRRAWMFRVYETRAGDALLRCAAGMKRAARTAAIGP